MNKNNPPMKKTCKIAILIVFIVSGILSIKHYQKEASTKNENYIKTEAEITHVFPSGRGYRISTLLTVKYTFDGIRKTATIRRSGYKEGAYSKGGTTTIYINPNNNEDIK
jgi:L-asparagine transporter-like permease